MVLGVSPVQGKERKDWPAGSSVFKLMGPAPDSEVVPDGCNPVELLRASREWARIMGPGTWLNVESVTEPYPIRMTWSFEEWNGNTMEQAEQRWRRAVEACTP